MLSAACPLMSETAPRTLVPSAVNVTAPVGVPAAVIVTINVTVWPRLLGLTDEEIEVALRANEIKELRFP